MAEVIITLNETEVRNAIKGFDEMMKKDPTATSYMVDMGEEITLTIYRGDDPFMKKVEDRKENPLDA